MDRPVRRSRQKMPPSGLIGILPQEEAAINRALHESLLLQEKKTIRHRQPSSAQPPSYFAFSDTTYERAGCREQADPEGTEDPTDVASTSSFNSKHRRLHSPLSPSHSLDSFDSSPARGSSGGGGSGGLFGGTSSSSLSSPRSVESSLKLVLSPTSWSRSTSPSWSPTPEPSTGTRPGKKAVTKPKKSKRYSAKAKKTVLEPPKPKGKRGRPRKYPPKDTASNSNKSTMSTSTTASLSLSGVCGTPKTYTKASLRYHGSKMVERKQQRQRRRGGGVNQVAGILSPEHSLVLHDQYCVEQGSAGLGSSRAGGPKSTIRSSPYAAQRKFAQNQVPNSTPTRLSRDEVEGLTQVKEIPKTEDFINFLCLRGSDSMPKELEIFSFPWTQLQRRRSKTGHDMSMRRKVLPFTATKGNNGKQKPHP